MNDFETLKKEIKEFPSPIGVICSLIKWERIGIILELLVSVSYRSYLFSYGLRNNDYKKEIFEGFRLLSELSVLLLVKGVSNLSLLKVSVSYRSYLFSYPTSNFPIFYSISFYCFRASL